MRTYNLFISHSWKYSGAYDGLVKLLNNKPYFVYKNYSVPFCDPINDAKSDWQLKNAIREQMRHANCVLVLAGVYASYSKWIDIEVDMALDDFTVPKPVIAIDPWGAERTSFVVKQRAIRCVKWQTDAIVSAIREYSI